MITLVEEYRSTDPSAQINGTVVPLVRTAPSWCDVDSLSSYLPALAAVGSVEIADTPNGLCISCLSATGDVVRALHISAEADEKARITRLISLPVAA